MDVSYDAYQGSLEIIDERIAVCSLLAKFDTDRRETYSEEISYLTPTERKRSIATYRRLVSKINEFVQALSEQGEHPPGVHLDLGPLLDEAEVALASDNIGVAVSRMQVLLSTAHKFITNYAPTAPAAKAPQMGITPAQRPSLDGTGKPKILLVDDDPRTLHRLLHFFRHEDRFDIFAANTTAEALQLLVEHEFDVVITDLIMRATDSRLQMDGREVALAAKKSSSKTKVIVLTAYIGMSITGELRTSGADVLIDKASEPAEVLQQAMEMLSPPPEKSVPATHKALKTSEVPIWKVSNRALSEITRYSETAELRTGRRAGFSDQPAWPEEFFSQLEAPGIIQGEYGNGGPAGCC